MITSGRAGAFGQCDDDGLTVHAATAPAYRAAMPDLPKRIARLRELVREFRRILQECTVFDGHLPDLLRQVIRDLEEEADRLERGQPPE